jgi:hypothetical protein
MIQNSISIVASCALLYVAHAAAPRCAICGFAAKTLAISGVNTHPGPAASTLPYRQVRARPRERTKAQLTNIATVVCGAHQSLVNGYCIFGKFLCFRTCQLCFNENDGCLVLCLGGRLLRVLSTYEKGRREVRPVSAIPAREGHPATGTVTVWQCVLLSADCSCMADDENLDWASIEIDNSSFAGEISLDDAEGHRGMSALRLVALRECDQRSRYSHRSFRDPPKARHMNLGSSSINICGPPRESISRANEARTSVHLVRGPHERWYRCSNVMLYFNYLQILLLSCTATSSLQS